MNATIVTIGDELLIGQIVDTNSASISRHLNSIGVVVAEKVSIGDSAEQITATLDRVMATSQIVIMTGGLGPTKDDITKSVLLEKFGGEMVEDRAVAGHVKTLLERKGIEFNELNRGQAMVPSSCEVIFNNYGTAPAMWFSDKGVAVVSLPGVPFEMEHIMCEEILPRLKERFDLRDNVHRTMITSGLPESILATAIEEWESALPASLKLAYLPNPNAVRLRLSAYNVDGQVAMAMINEQFDKLKSYIPDNIVGFESATVEALVHDELIKQHKTLAVAESCTGGVIASRFTAMAGASEYFLCGVVSYSNEAKNEVLGVENQLIEEFGAVSEQVACAMAAGVRKLSGSDFAVSTTGIAGPTGGSESKPVGTVWIGVAFKDGVFAECHNCGNDRGQVIQRASAIAISMLRRQIDRCAE